MNRFKLDTDGSWDYLGAPEDWSIDSRQGFEVGVKSNDGSWDDLGAWSSVDECVKEIKDCAANQFDDFFVDDYDCVVFAISKEGGRWDRVLKCYRDGTIIEESGCGVVVGQVS